MGERVRTALLVAGLVLVFVAAGPGQHAYSRLCAKWMIWCANIIEQVVCRLQGKLPPLLRCEFHAFGWYGPLGLSCYADGTLMCMEDDCADIRTVCEEQKRPATTIANDSDDEL